MVFRASAARPPAEPVPATINAALAMHIGHIEFLVSLIVEGAGPRSTSRFRGP
jgi:hypothetical protein